MVPTSAFKDVYGPYAVIAGGSDGLGFAFAEAAARRGVNLVLIARQEERLQASANRLKDAFHVDVVPLAADMADVESVITQLDALNKDIGLLVYNAALCPIGPFEHQTSDELSLATAVNVRAPLLLAKHLSASMISRGRGGIVLMSSLAGGQGSPNIAAYAATKSFNATLAEGLWSELKPHGVDVLACCAGAILTPGYNKAETSKPAPGTMTPEQVAETTLDALGRGPIVVPGAMNKVGRFALSRILSRRAAIAIMSKNTGGLT